MNHIKFFKEISKKDVNIAGGKGASLGEMTQAGIAVPPGFVIVADAFDRFMEETNLREEIAGQLAKANPEDINSVEKVSVALRGIIHDTPLPTDLQKEILTAYKKLDAQFVAVRSSATAEDSSIASWAGELETYLNTTEENVLERVKQCWSSLFTPRAIFYRHEKGLIDAKVSVAVVIQKMIQSEVSGVAFTVHPVTEDYNQMIIEAVFGLGEAIVGGLVTPDSYVVSKTDWSLLDLQVSEQTRKLVKSKRTPTTPALRATPPLAGGDTSEANEWLELSASDGGKQKLSGRQIVELAKVFSAIEKHYGFPCDIEWAIEKGELFITQSRPITTLKKNV